MKALLSPVAAITALRIRSKVDATLNVLRGTVRVDGFVVLQISLIEEGAA